LRACFETARCRALGLYAPRDAATWKKSFTPRKFLPGKQSCMLVDEAAAESLDRRAIFRAGSTPPRPSEIAAQTATTVQSEGTPSWPK